MPFILKAIQLLIHFSLNLTRKERETLLDFETTRVGDTGLKKWTWMDT